MTAGRCIPVMGRILAPFTRISVCMNRFPFSNEFNIPSYWSSEIIISTIQCPTFENIISFCRVSRFGCFLTCFNNLRCYSRAAIGIIRYCIFCYRCIIFFKYCFYSHCTCRHCEFAICNRYNCTIGSRCNFPFFKFIAAICCCCQSYCVAFFCFCDICTCCTIAVIFNSYCVRSRCVFLNGIINIYHIISYKRIIIVNISSNSYIIRNRIAFVQF